MKKISKFSLITVLFICIAVIFNSCEKKQPALPSVTTTKVSEITATTATFEGNVTDDGGSAVTARGVCWCTSPDPSTADNQITVGSGTGSYTCDLTGLNASTTYYISAYATNSVGTAYGMHIQFTTLDAQLITVTDIDGNVYEAVTIGDQVWMKENLKTTKYNDDTAIPNVTDNTEWENLTTGAYSWYNNYPAAYKDTYGALYNWYAAGTGKLCPDGWHVPTHSDWAKLADFLGGEAKAGGKLKEAGTSHWFEPNIGATNESSFTALPNGVRHDDGVFWGLGEWCSMWSATEGDSDDAIIYMLYYNYSDLYHAYRNKNFGFSIRCLMD